ncbi:MAG: hypothetical protein PUE36_06655 [Bacteroidales bacterium]|nr:hypothetical protein [Bacteroidales bacterium]
MKFKYKLSASISASTLRRVYAALEDEQKPFVASIKRIAKDARKGDKRLLITIENNDRDYFAAVLNQCKD